MRQKRSYNVGIDNPMYGSKRTGIDNPMYGKKLSDEVKKIIGDSNRGKNNYWFGKKRSEEWKKRVSDKMKNTRLGKNNPAWRGDNVGYINLHVWVKTYLPRPKFCQKCNERPPYDLANITGIYNREFENWAYLCRRCHVKSDGRINNLKQFRMLATA
jgi:NUMOD3 motif